MPRHRGLPSPPPVRQPPFLCVFLYSGPSKPPCHMEMDCLRAETSPDEFGCKRLTKIKESQTIQSVCLSAIYSTFSYSFHFICLSEQGPPGPYLASNSLSTILPCSAGSSPCITPSQAFSEPGPHPRACRGWVPITPCSTLLHSSDYHHIACFNHLQCKLHNFSNPSFSSYLRTSVFSRAKRSPQHDDASTIGTSTVVISSPSCPHLFTLFCSFTCPGSRFLRVDASTNGCSPSPPPQYFSAYSISLLSLLRNTTTSSSERCHLRTSSSGEQYQSTNPRKCVHGFRHFIGLISSNRVQSPGGLWQYFRNFKKQYTDFLTHTVFGGILYCFQPLY